jgi:transcriptional regulator with XRE-family HTH domain
MSGVFRTDHLRALIQAARDAGHWRTYDELAQRSGLAKSSVYSLATKKTRAEYLSDEQLQAIADGIRMPVDRVTEAYRADIGVMQVSVEGMPADMVVLTEAVKTMTPEARQRWVAMALEIAKPYQSSGDQ